MAPFRKYVSRLISRIVYVIALYFLDESSLVPPAPVDSDGESDNSDRVPVPSFQNSFSQAIEAAFMKLDTPATSDALSGKGKEPTGSAQGYLSHLAPMAESLISSALAPESFILGSHPSIS